MANVSDTMASIRWMLNKYAWMASDNNQQLPVDPKDRPFRPGLSETEKKKIISLYKRGKSVEDICQHLNRSDTAIRNLLSASGLLKRKKIK